MSSGIRPASTPACARCARAASRVTGLEALRDFEGLDGRMHAYKVDVAKSMLEVCGRLGGRLLLVEASTSTHAAADADSIARDLRMLAILAIPMGIRIAYKGVAWSRTTKDFAAAGELVFRANCPNLGVAIDAFDVIAARISRDELDAIDPQQIFLVQLSDYMWQEIRSAEEQAATATHFRVFPGRGRAQRRARRLHHQARRDRLLRRLQLRRVQRRLPADASRNRRRSGAARGRMARRNGAAARAADTEHGASAAHGSPLSRAAVALPANRRHGSAGRTEAKG